MTPLGSNAHAAVFCVECQGICLALVFLPVKWEVQHFLIHCVGERQHAQCAAGHDARACCPPLPLSLSCF